MDDERIKYWVSMAEEMGFSHAGKLNPETLKAEKWVRETCASDKCHAYGHNWTCPPACGTLEECEAEMKKYKNGILLQTVGTLKRRIDAKAYIQTEEKHKELFLKFADRIRMDDPEALCLGSGGCRVCQTCAYPKPCRFPQKACSSMEAYGLFVTQVCRDNNMKYYYGPQTITYTACILFSQVGEG